MCVEGLGKLGRLRGLTGQRQLREHPGVDRVGHSALALREQLRKGEVGAVLATTGCSQQLVHGFLRVDLAQVAAAVDLTQVVMGRDFRCGGFLQVLLGLDGIGRDPFAFVVQAAKQQFGARLVRRAAVVQVFHHLVDVAQFGKS